MRPEAEIAAAHLVLDGLEAPRFATVVVPTRIPGLDLVDQVELTVGERLRRLVDRLDLLLAALDPRRGPGALADDLVAVARRENRARRLARYRDAYGDELEPWDPDEVPAEELEPWPDDLAEQPALDCGK